MVVVSLLLCVDVGDGRLIRWRLGIARLFAMTYEVFEVLYRRHGFSISAEVDGTWLWEWKRG